MRLEYKSKRVEKLITDFDKLYKIMSIDLQKKLKITLNRLESAENLSEFLALGLGTPHPLQNNLNGYYGVKLTGNVRLVVKPNDGDLNSNIIIVKGVCDYHGEKEEWIIP